jgi:sucrose phosphorylase
MGAKGILPEEEIGFIVEKAREGGALVSNRATPDGGSEPYEINSTWWSAINNNPRGKDIDLQVRRYLASRSIALSLKGVPGLYIHGVLGSENDYGAFKASGVKRDLNRGIIDARDVEEALCDPQSKLSLMYRYGIKQIRSRRLEEAFHPQGSQRVLMLSSKVFAVLRVSPEGSQHVLAITGVTGESVGIEVRLKDLNVSQCRWRDLLGGGEWTAREEVLHLVVEPYGVLWLKPLGQ